MHYSVPLKNEATAGTTVTGTIRLIYPDNLVIAEQTMPPTFVPPNTTIYVEGVICAPSEEIRRFQIEIVVPGRACSVKTKTQPVQDTCPTPTPTVLRR